MVSLFLEAFPTTQINDKIQFLKNLVNPQQDIQTKFIKPMKDSLYFSKPISSNPP